MVLIHYGYSSASETSDSSKMWNYWSGEILEEIIGIIIALAVCGAAVGATVGTGGLAAPVLE